MEAIVAQSQPFNLDDMVDSLQNVQAAAIWVYLAWPLEALCSQDTLWESLFSIQSHWIVLFNGVQLGWLSKADQKYVAI